VSQAAAPWPVAFFNVRIEKLEQGVHLVFTPGKVFDAHAWCNQLFTHRGLHDHDASGRTTHADIFDLTP
jgi:hypothetical protein